MRIAIFDYRTKLTNPTGGCLLRMLRGLCHEHDFVVFSTEFDNPCPERIRFIRIPVPRRPLVLLFLCFHIVAPLVYLLYRLRHRPRFDLVQINESILLFGDLSYSHFCHRAYLREHRQPGRGIYFQVQLLHNRLHSLLEPLTFRRVSRVVVPSEGLKRELIKYYPASANKITVLSNPVDLARMVRAKDFDRAIVRKELNLGAGDLALVFVALGHFERKGLPQLLAAMVELGDPRVKLLVVGGEKNLCRRYADRVDEMGLQGRVQFLGMQRDVRPYFWAADAFILPSAYEVFPLVSLEAAAAATPLICTPLNGVEEFLIDGVNGFLVQRDPTAICEALRRFAALAPEVRQSVARRAASDVQRYGVETFCVRWKEVYASLERDPAISSRSIPVGEMIK